MKELIRTCIVKHGTQMWYRDSVTGKSHFEIIPTHPSQVRPERELCLGVNAVTDAEQVKRKVSTTLIKSLFTDSIN
jgi:hypothetical protein